MQISSGNIRQSGYARQSGPPSTFFSEPYPESPAQAPQEEKENGAASLTQALGWFGVGAGVVQVVAPGAVAKVAGIDPHPVLLRALGAREIASGVGLLSRRRQAGWLWLRIAGDVMDLALLGMAATASGNAGTRRKRLALASAAVTAVTVLDVVSTLRHNKRHADTEESLPPGEIHVEKCITVNRSADECYRFWQDFENFPRFMQHLEKVQKLSETESHWRAKAPAGASVEWNAEIIDDQPGELLAWRSIGESDIRHAGTVRFESASGGRGTVVRVELQYKPPLGKTGAMLAKLFGEEPALQIDQDLRRFKQLMETGEIATTVGQPSGPRSMLIRLLARKGESG